MNDDRVTIRHVARTAGVSIATVSRVFAGSAAVSEALQERVREAARELDYVPDEVARSLARGRTSVVGVLVPNLANPYVCGLIKRTLHEAENDDHRLIVADTDENRDVEASVGVGLLQRSDGLIVYSPRGELDVVESLAEHGKPVVVVNRPVESTRVANVLVQSYQAMRDLADHVADLGHRRVAYVHGPRRAWPDAERWRAVSALSERGVEVLAIGASGTLGDGRDAVPVALDAGCTAILAVNDLTAFGVLGALRERGLRVPEDVSVTGFDDVPLSACVCPTLTSARAWQSEAGTATWRTLADMLSGGEPTRVELHAEAVIRDSTAPPPR